jgi:hypothetical protein
MNIIYTTLYAQDDTTIFLDGTIEIEVKEHERDDYSIFLDTHVDELERIVKQARDFMEDENE